MSNKLLDLIREIRPNAVWDFIKLGMGLILASSLGIIYWLVQQYREAPFSVIVMFSIFLISFVLTVFLFFYQKIKTTQATEKQWFETPENDLILKQNESISTQEDLIPKPLENKERIQPVPTFLIQKAEVPVLIPNSRNLMSIKSDNTNPDAIVFALEVRFQPTIDISGSIEVDAHLQIDKNPRNKGLWLKARKEKVRLSAGESDYLILTVKRLGNFHQYEIIQERLPGRRLIPIGNFLKLSSDLMFEVEIVAKQVGKVVFTGIAQLRIFDGMAEVSEKIEGEDTIFFGFTKDSPIHDGLMSIEPKLLV